MSEPGRAFFAAPFPRRSPFIAPAALRRRFSVHSMLKLFATVTGSPENAGTRV